MLTGRNGFAMVDDHLGLPAILRTEHLVLTAWFLGPNEDLPGWHFMEAHYEAAECGCGRGNQNDVTANYPRSWTPLEAPVGDGSFEFDGNFRAIDPSAGLGTLAG